MRVNLWQKSPGHVTQITTFIPVECDVYHDLSCHTALPGSAARIRMAACHRAQNHHLDRRMQVPLLIGLLSDRVKQPMCRERPDSSRGLCRSRGK